jgi:hypothetical protein
MLNSNYSPSPVIASRRAQDASAWVTKWQSTACLSLAAAIEDDNLTLHSTTTGEWLASVYWGAERVLVLEAEIDSPLYEFQCLKTAHIFLDAVLRRYVAKAEELSLSAIN